MVEVHGQVDQDFGPVGDAIQENFARHDEMGMSVCVFYKGRQCVDAWAGLADKKSGRPWGPDTVVNLWSSSKGLMAILLARLVDAGRLDYEAPVVDYWPEFAAAGKAGLTVAELLSHQTGLTGPRSLYPPGVSRERCNEILSELLSQEPFWRPGSAHGYHALSIGLLVEELVHRVCEVTLAAAWKEYVADPFGLDTDAFIGYFPVECEVNVAAIVQPEVVMPVAVEEMSACQQAAMINVPVSAEIAGTREWREIGLASAGGTGNARGLAKAYAGLPMHLTAKTLQRATEPRVSGVDQVLGMETTFGCGFQLNTQCLDFGPNPQAFGHAGWGGSFGMLDPDRQLSIGYTMNRMGVAERQDPRAGLIIDAVYACVEGQ